MSRNTGGLGDVLRVVQNVEAMSELRKQLDYLLFTSNKTIRREEIIKLLTIITH
jgi:hypothetical protein